MNSDQILSIARQKGQFFVAPHYRFDGLRQKCNRLVREGHLKRARDWRKLGRYGDWYLPVPVNTEGGES